MYYNRILRVPEQSFFLLGPRGTGKTTWLRHEFQQAHMVNLLDEALYQALLANPALFAAKMLALPEDSWVIVDEIQRLPNLLNEVHRFMEERHMRFVLCGSSARKLKRTGVNLLAGRALMRHMHPFVPAELGDRFDLETALQYGLLPVVWSSDERKDALAAYAQLYLKEEIHGEALVRNLPAFSRFLPLAAIFHGQTIYCISLRF
jgi:predicted AAA+ superfamily ATPase